MMMIRCSKTLGCSRHFQLGEISALQTGCRVGCKHSFNTFCQQRLAFSRTCRQVAVLSSGDSQQTTPHLEEDWLEQNAEVLRSVPLAAGAFGIVAVLANRVVNGIAPVVDASSSQSRGDVLVIVLSATLLLTGLQWLSLKPKQPTPVVLEGQQVEFFDEGLPAPAVQEMKWAWQSLRDVAGSASMIVLVRGRCLMHVGYAEENHRPGAAKMGAICEQVMKSGKGNYFANLAPYPGRIELTTFLPDNTQCAIVHPLGDRGVVVLGANVQRAFSKVDQAWIADICDKLDATLDKFAASGSGFAAAKSVSGKKSKQL